MPPGRDLSPGIGYFCAMGSGASLRSSIDVGGRRPSGCDESNTPQVPHLKQNDPSPSAACGSQDVVPRAVTAVTSLFTSPHSQHRATISCVSLRATSRRPKGDQASTQRQRRLTRGATSASHAMRRWSDVRYTPKERTSSGHDGLAANGMARPRSRPASERSWLGAAKTRSTPCLSDPTTAQSP
jgi:hypothetical protein